MSENETPDRQTEEAWSKNPDNVKLGMFYANKEDKRLFPPKRDGTGWSVNFANPASVRVFVGILFLIVLGVALGAWLLVRMTVWLLG